MLCRRLFLRYICRGRKILSGLHTGTGVRCFIKIQLFLPLLAFVSLWCAQVWGLKRGYIEQKYRKTVTVGVTLLPIMTLIFILLFSMPSSKIGGVSMTEKFDCGKDNLASKYTYVKKIMLL